METFRQDLRYALRGLTRNPGLTLIIAVTLALGIGANTAIFSIVDALFLRLPPVKEPERLMRIVDARADGKLSYLNYADYREQQDAFSGVAAWNGAGGEVQIDDVRVHFDGRMVSHDYFAVMGIPPLSGRTFTEDDAREGAPEAVMISEAFWRRHFAADDRRLAGRKLRLGDRELTPVGVVATAFTIEDPGQDLWFVLRPGALVTTKELQNRDVNMLWLEGRLKPGMSQATAQAMTDGIARRLAEIDPKVNTGMRASVLSQRQWRLRRGDAPFYALLLALVGAVLLLACANVTNLLLARANARAREITIRAAVGATRLRLARQLLVESLLLSLLGGVLGAGVGYATVAFFSRLTFGGGSTLPSNIRLDVRVLVFTGLVSVGIGLLFGLAPALHAARHDLVAALRAGGDGTRVPGRRRFPLMKALVVGQVALSLVLLVCTGLFARTLQRMWDVDLGYRPERLVWFRLDLGSLRYDEARTRQLYADVSERVRQVPGVAGVAVGPPPLAGYSWTNVVVDDVKDQRETLFTTVTPGYFETLGTPIVRGRDFREDDKTGTAGVVIVNEAMVRRFWPDRDPIGQHFKPFPVTVPREVIGVVRDVRTSPWDPPQPAVYFCFHQRYNLRELLVRTEGDPRAVAGAVQAQILGVEPNALLRGPLFFGDAMQGPLAPIRYRTVVLGALAALGLLLSSLGLYGLLSYTVSRATRDIGIRMALGADRASVRRLVLGGSLRLVAVGVALGLALAAAAARPLSALIIGPVLDPVTFVVVPTTLVAVALMAAYVPARRATRVDPMTALRQD
jgi:putative ABC transport system permease protein